MVQKYRRENSRNTQLEGFKLCTILSGGMKPPSILGSGPSPRPHPHTVGTPSRCSPLVTGRTLVTGLAVRDPGARVQVTRSVALLAVPMCQRRAQSAFFSEKVEVPNLKCSLGNIANNIVATVRGARWALTRLIGGSLCKLRKCQAMCHTPETNIK